MRIFSYRLSAVSESRKIPGSQVSYILGYSDGAVAFATYIVYADGVATFIPHMV